MIGLILMAPVILLMIDRSEPTKPSIQVKERKFQDNEIVFIHFHS